MTHCYIDPKGVIVLCKLGAQLADEAGRKLGNFVRYGDPDCAEQAKEYLDALDAYLDHVHNCTRTERKND